MSIDWIQFVFSLIFFSVCLILVRYAKKAFYIWKEHGLKALLAKTYQFLKKRLCLFNFKSEPLIDKKIEKTVSEIVLERFPVIRPIHILKIHKSDFRINLVTDSIQKNSCFGGVATSLILVTLFANKFHIPLRIVARRSDINPLDYITFLSLMKIPKPKKVEFFTDYLSIPGNEGLRLEVSDKDIFLSTSWWSSHVVKSINFRKSFFYILQEVENFFYPNGDEQFMSEAILNDSDINYIINSKMLYDYYETNNYKNVLERSVVFEPAFPDHMYQAENHAFQKKDKKNLFFYARPNHNRNLFYTGLNILDEAISTGLISSDWNIFFAGSDDIPALMFSNGLKPTILGQLNGKKYLDFIKSIDLCFSLMRTPHPSYVPLDIAAVGGVVLTNKYATKHCIHHSKNIICENLNEKSLLKGLDQAIQLSLNIEKRYENYSNNKIEKNWEKNFEHTLNYMFETK